MPTALLSTEEVLPDPARLVEGLRDTGYTFNTAISDIVDNSIAARARTIFIRIDQDSFTNNIRVSIADDGHGMDKNGLIKAMQYGAAERAEKHSLGKFGLGLKTASTSCCTRLKVISRNEPDKELTCAVWDLDHIAREHKWELLFERPTGDDCEDFEECAEDGSGTVVVWENCDRLLSGIYKNPDTVAFKEALKRSIDILRQHLAMVFQRFLDPNDHRADTVKIVLNGEPVEFWDPFCSELNGPIIQPNIGKDLGLPGDLTVRAFIVKPKRDLPTPAEKQRVMPGHNNKTLNKAFPENSLSGFYIYRENRLIHWGEWFGLANVDFHANLCRFELSFSSELDNMLQVDIKKSKIQPDAVIREELLHIANPVVKKGIQVYRGAKRSVAKESGVDLHHESQANLDSAHDSMVRFILSKNDNGEVIIDNKYGKSITNYKAVDGEYLYTVENELLDGILWEPALIQKEDGASKNGVRINAGHDYYQRYYGANKENPIAVTGLDYMLWALAEAEINATDQESADYLSDFRYEVSKILRGIARKSMPDVSVDDLENGEEE